MQGGAGEGWRKAKACGRCMRQGGRGSRLLLPVSCSGRLGELLGAGRGEQVVVPEWGSYLVVDRAGPGINRRAPSCLRCQVRGGRGELRAARSWGWMGRRG